MGVLLIFRLQFQAMYYHRASHQLNLAISKTAKVIEIQIMLFCWPFFKYSPKQQRQLEKSVDEYNESLDPADGISPIKKTKLKTMCQTRWVERHTSMQDFDCMYSALCVCLDDIARNTDMVWDGSTVSEAQGLLHKN